MTTSDLVPQSFPVAIDGTPLMLDMASDQFVGPVTIPVIREQSDSSVTPGAGTLNRNDAWRAVMTDWSHGAGQTWVNDPASDPARFRQSKGVDPWTPGQLSLLTGTATLATASTSYSYMDAYISHSGDSISPDAAVYVFDGGVGTGTYKRLRVNSSDSLVSTTSLTGFAGTHGGSAQRRNVASDRGFSVYFIDGNDKVRLVSNGGTATSPGVTFTGGITSITGIWYAKHHILCAAGPGFLIFDYSTPTAAAITIPASGLGETVDICEGQSRIYIAGNWDGRPIIYSVTVDPATSALGGLQVAATLPTGETIQAAYGYGGLVFVGTDQGFRTCAERSDGSLEVGALVSIGKPVRCFNALGDAVYFGWSNYDGSDGGLGRINPTVFTDSNRLIPAYATDLMAVSQTGNVTDISVFDNGGGAYKPYFLANTKLYNKTSTTIASGTIDSGFINYELSDPKTATAIDVRTQALAANASVAVSITNVYGGSPASVATYNTTSGTGTLMAVTNVAGSEHEIRLTLAANTTTPVVSAVTLFAQPRSAVRGEMWQLPVLLGYEIQDLRGKNWKFDPYTVIAALRALVASSAPVTVQLGTYSDTMFVEDFEFHGRSWLLPGAPNATGIVTVKNLSP